MYRSLENIGREAEFCIVVFSTALNSAALVPPVGSTASKYFIVALTRRSVLCKIKKNIFIATARK